jgi:hypothetical protein
VSGRNWLAVLCLVGGVPLAAWGLANGVLLAGLAGLALVLVFWALVWQWLAGAGRPMGAEGRIKPSAEAVWAMKDEPAGRSEPNK